MKQTKYLTLRSKEDLIITSHTSCILDDKFYERHTKEGKIEKEFRKRRNDILEEEKLLTDAKNARKKKEKRERKDKKDDNKTGKTKLG